MCRLVPAHVPVLRLLLGVMALAGTLEGQSQASWFGTWKFNPAKSLYNPGPPPFRNATLKIEPWQGDVRIALDMIRPRGGVTHLEWTGRFDGRDYPLQGVDDYVITNAYRRIDDRTYAIVQKVEGQGATTASMTLSPDGRTITIVTSGESAQSRPVATTVYDRQ